MRNNRPIEPFLWLLFSAGGVMAALFFPVLIFLFGVAFPLGWLQPPPYDRLLALVGHPLTRVVLFGVCSLSLFHWAHRFRYTLYDGLQLKWKWQIALVCYGGALAGAGAAFIILGQVW